MSRLTDAFLKTRVYKWDDRWWCDYVLPYSGRLAADFDTWQEAYDDACGVERYREYA